jgi:hypothetical protein
MSHSSQIHRFPGNDSSVALDSEHRDEPDRRRCRSREVLVQTSGKEEFSGLVVEVWSGFFGCESFSSLIMSGFSGLVVSVFSGLVVQGFSGLVVQGFSD